MLQKTKSRNLSIKIQIIKITKIVIIKCRIKYGDDASDFT